MNTVLAFVIGALCGAVLGMICTALMVAGRDDRE